MEELRIKRKQEETAALEKDLEGILPKVNEANMIAAELKRDIRFNVKMVSTMPDFGDIKDTKRQFVIKCDNSEDGYFYNWNPDKFTNRLEMMKEDVNTYFDTGVAPVHATKETDAFWDPPEPVLIGTSYLKLANLGYVIESTNPCKILSTAGAGSDTVQGQLHSAYWPVTA